ncbi:hypothetical protein HED55_06490 [Ochrobactrum haematophilum]|uniref:A/G-specific adenine glycosylase n=1 Tax=Brucella haematophila TaxID=419474 RepID=A0ABX1DNC4_9HYPH|nr:hypothetical protein [Brucella haematophila]
MPLNNTARPITASHKPNSGSKRSSQLLAWYDRHHRVLPWRVTPSEQARGMRPDPYRVWLSEIMLQQTTVEAVKSYFTAFCRALAERARNGKRHRRRHPSGLGRARLLFTRPQSQEMR